jgi:hypothetical protein
MFFHPNLNLIIAKKTKSHYILHDTQHKTQISGNTECGIISDIGYKLHHFVKFPDLRHAEAHEHHEAEWDYQGQEHCALGLAPHAADLKEIGLGCHLGWDQYSQRVLDR